MSEQIRDVLERPIEKDRPSLEAFNGPQSPRGALSPFQACKPPHRGKQACTGKSQLSALFHMCLNFRRTGKVV